MAGKAAVGKSEKGEKEWDRMRGGQTERVGGWRRRKRGEDRLPSL
jgi:hypothetical protein